MSDNGDWIRVTPKRKCPVCGKDSWCGIGKTNGNILCMRIESTIPIANGGWLHRTNESYTNVPLHKRNGHIGKVADFQWLNESYGKAATNAKVAALAKELGVSSESLRQLEIGWSGEFWTLPMYDTKRIIGLMRRWPDGKKKTMEGGHLGVGIPLRLPKDDEPWFITEGASDCAALLTIGLYARWRASCSSSVKMLVEMCVGRRVVLVADSDTPGLRGARELKAKLPKATVFVPPVGKDVREFLLLGGSRQDLEHLIGCVK